MPDLTLAQAMDVFEKHEIPHAWVDEGTVLEVARAMKAAGDTLAAEIRRRDGETCETCRRVVMEFGCECCELTAVEVENNNGPNWFTYTACETLGNGCRAWQKREGE